MPALRTGVLSHRVIWARPVSQDGDGVSWTGKPSSSVCEAAQQSHAEHNGGCLFIPAEERGTYLFWVSCVRIHIVLYARASLRCASLQYGSDLKTARHTEINVSSTHRTSPDLGLMSINVISKKQMFKKEKQQKYLRDSGGCSRAVDAIQGDAEELLGERNPRNKRLENRVTLTGEQSRPERKEDIIKVHGKKYDLYQSGLYFRSYSETERKFFLHISDTTALTSPWAKVPTAHILLKDIIVRASTEEELKRCSINNLKCCTLYSYKGRHEPTERDVQLQSKRFWA